MCGKIEKNSYWNKNWCGSRYGPHDYDSGNNDDDDDDDDDDNAKKVNKIKITSQQSKKVKVKKK